MSMWGILGIEPTDDLSAIKKAYAAKLKIYHPEDDPQGFQKLREAYDNAVKYAKRIKEKKSGNSALADKPEAINGSEQRSDAFELGEYDDFDLNFNIPFNMSDLKSSLQHSSNFSDLLNEFIQKAENLYNDFSARIEIESWKALLNDDIMWDITNRNYVSARFLDFLCSHSNIPQNIWVYLENNFNWSKQKDLLHSNFPEEEIEFIIDKLKRKKTINFRHLIGLPIKDLEDYLSCRENALDALIKDDVIKGDHYIKMAKQLYEDDPDLLRLEGESYLSYFSKDAALNLFNKALSINPEDKETLLLRAELYFRCDKLKESIEDYVKIIELYPDCKEAYPPLAKCYIRTKDLYKAKECILKAIELTPSDLSYKKTLLEINMEIKKNLLLSCLFKPFNKNIRHTMKEVRHEIKQLQRENSIVIEKNLPPRKLYVRIAVIVIISVTVLLALNEFFNSDRSDYESDYSYSIKSTPAATKPPVAVVDRITLNDSNVETLKAGTNVKAAMTSLYSLDLYWLRTKSTNGTISNQFIPIPDKVSFVPSMAMGIGTLNGKHILVLGADTYSDKNAQPVYINGKILALDSMDAVTMAKQQVQSQKLRNIDRSKIITDKYIAVDRSVTTSGDPLTIANDVTTSKFSSDYKSSTSSFTPGVTQFVFLIILIGIITRYRRG